MKALQTNKYNAFVLAKKIKKHSHYKISGKGKRMYILPISRRMDKEVVVHIHHGILLSH